MFGAAVHRYRPAVTSVKPDNRTCRAVRMSNRMKRKRDARLSRAGLTQVSASRGGCHEEVVGVIAAPLIYRER